MLLILIIYVFWAGVGVNDEVPFLFASDIGVHSARLPQLVHLQMKFVEIFIWPLHLVRRIGPIVQNVFSLLSVGRHDRIGNDGRK